MTEPTTITQLTPLEEAEQSLASEVALEEAVCDAAATYIASSEDTPLAVGPGSGPLWDTYSELFDRQVVQGFRVQETCAAAGRKGWLLWEAGAVAREERADTHRAVFHGCYLSRAKYKMEQEPALILNANEWKALRVEEVDRDAAIFARFSLEAERRAEVAYISDYQDYLDSDEDTPLPQVGDGPAFLKAVQSALKKAKATAYEACSAAGENAMELWRAREPVRVATRVAFDRLSDERTEARADYKERQEPKLPLSPAEYELRWRQANPKEAAAMAAEHKGWGQEPAATTSEPAAPTSEPSPVGE